MKAIIRPYTPADKTGCLAAYHSNVPVFFAPHEAAEYEAFLETDVFDPEVFYFVLTIGPAIVACGGYGYEKEKHEVHFIFGLVDYSHHGQGLGKQLTAFRMQAISRRYAGIPLRLDTSQHTYGFYEKAGFRVDKITPDGYAPGLDRYDMTWVAEPSGIWVFNGANSAFPAGVFSTRPLAEAWIARHGLTGTLTLYPVDQGVYDWSLANGSFTIKREEQRQAAFIQQFSSASQEHYHYEAGKEV